MKNAKSPEHPLGSIVRSFHAPLETAAVESSKAKPENQGRTLQKGMITLSPANLKTPALLLNDSFEIVWHNAGSEKELFLFQEGDGKKKAGKNLFHWLCDPHYQSNVVNWRQWIRFFLQHASGMVPRQRLTEIIDGLIPRHLQLSDKTLHPGPVFNRNIFSGCIRQVRTNGELTTFHVVATDFEQGRLFVFDSRHPRAPEPGLAAKVAEMEHKLEVLRSNSRQSLHGTLHLLSARLDNAEILRAELLADEYNRLLTRLWQTAIEIIENHGGMVAQDGDIGLVGYFLPADDPDESALPVIECALQLKMKMAELGREWRIRLGWLHDLALNLGLHSDEDYLGLIRTSMGESLTLFGRAQEVAAHLSRMGSNGQIWATKAFINRLSAEERQRLRFGVTRQDNQRQVFISRCFSRIKDLGVASDHLPRRSESGEMDHLAVAQIFELKDDNTTPIR